MTKSTGCGQSKYIVHTHNHCHLFDTAYLHILRKMRNRWCISAYFKENEKSMVHILRKMINRWYVLYTLAIVFFTEGDNERCQISKVLAVQGAHPILDAVIQWLFLRGTGQILISLVLENHLFAVIQYSASRIYENAELSTTSEEHLYACHLAIHHFQAVNKPLQIVLYHRFQSIHY